jgi:hypothetical protein
MRIHARYIEIPRYAALLTLRYKSLLVPCEVLQVQTSRTNMGKRGVFLRQSSVYTGHSLLQRAKKSFSHTRGEPDSTV